MSPEVPGRCGTSENYGLAETGGDLPWLEVSTGFDSDLGSMEASP